MQLASANGVLTTAVNIKESDVTAKTAGMGGKGHDTLVKGCFEENTKCFYERMSIMCYSSLLDHNVTTKHGAWKVTEWGEMLFRKVESK